MKVGGGRRARGGLGLGEREGASWRSGTWCLSPAASARGTAAVPHHFYHSFLHQSVFIYTGRACMYVPALTTGKCFVLLVGSPQRTVWGRSRALGARRLRSEVMVATRRDHGSWPWAAAPKSCSVPKGPCPSPHKPKGPCPRPWRRRHTACGCVGH